MTTLFSRIIDGELPGRFVWSDDLAVAFLTIAPIAPGHTLVVPRTEVDRFTAASDELLGHLAHVAAVVGRAGERAWPGTRASLLVAGFEVPHLHLHVVPVRGEGELSFDRARSDTPAADLDDAAHALRASLVASGHAAAVPASPGSSAL